MTPESASDFDFGSVFVAGLAGGALGGGLGSSLGVFASPVRSARTLSVSVVAGGGGVDGGWVVGV